MPPSEFGLSRRAIGWALLSQAIWLPLLAIAVYDRWPSASPSPASGAEGEAGSVPVSSAPLSLRDLAMASGAPLASPVAATAAVAPGARSSAGLVLHSPAGTAGLTLPPAPAAAAGSAAADPDPDGAAGSPAAAALTQPRAEKSPGPQRDRRAAAPPASRSEAAPAALPASGPAQRAASLSQRLGGPIALRDLSGAPIGSVASLGPGPGGGKPAGGQAVGRGAGAGGFAPGSRPTRVHWAPPPPLPPLP